MSASASSVGGKETQLQMEEARRPQELTITQHISLQTPTDTTACQRGHGQWCLLEIWGAWRNCGTELVQASSVRVLPLTGSLRALGAAAERSQTPRVHGSSL